MAQLESSSPQPRRGDSKGPASVALLNARFIRLILSLLLYVVVVVAGAGAAADDVTDLYEDIFTEVKLKM